MPQDFLLLIRNVRAIRDHPKHWQRLQPLAAFCIKVTIASLSVEYLKKSLPLSEQRYWRKQNCVSHVCEKSICSGNDQILGKAEKTANSSHNTHFPGAERVYPSKSPSNNNNSNSNAGANQIKLSSVQSSSKTTTFSSLSNVKSLLQVTEIQLKSSSSKDTTALVFCDTACSNSWVSNDVANRLGLHGTALKLEVRCIITEEVVDTKLVELIVTPRDIQAFEPFKVSPYVKEDLSEGGNAINIKAVQETYPHLAVLDPVTYCYGNIEMVLGQNVYHAIRPLEYFSADEKDSPFAVRLPIGWVLSGPLPSSPGLVSQIWSRILNSLVR